MRYNFEWDAEKAQVNRQKHGIGFEEAASVFHDPHMCSLFDSEHSGEEDRWITLGISSLGRLLVVCHTFRDGTAEDSVIRIFSSRRATQRETRQYVETRGTEL
jgi:uncharacterized protein